MNLILNTYKVMGLIKNDIDLNSFILHNSFRNELNSEEKEYLKTKKSFTYCSHNDLMPFEATLNNKHIGIIEEYLVEITKNLDRVWQMSDLLLIDGKEWYYKARDYANELSIEFKIDLYQSAAIISALSPLKSWDLNKKIAKEFLEGKRNIH